MPRTIVPNLNQLKESILIDCGLLQGLEAELESNAEKTSDQILSNTIPFEISHIKVLIVTNVHIDHVGRIPHLLAGPIYCSEPSAKLLPLVLEDAVKVGLQVINN